MGHELPEYSGPESFEVMNRLRVDREDAAAIVAAWEDRTGEAIAPAP